MQDAQNIMEMAKAALAVECRRSLYRFLLEFWPVVCDKQLSANWHLEYLCGEAQAMVERIERGEPSIDLVVNIPPGTTKSTIFSQMLPAWVWTRRPSFRAITSSWEDDLAMKSARLSRDIIASPKYRALFQEVVLRGDMAAVSRYGTAAGGLRIITSTKASPTGEHADLTIIDDPIGKSQVVSEAMREQATRHMEALSSRRTDKVVSSMIMVMQRLHPSDPTEWMLSHAGSVKHICLPAELSDMVTPAELRDSYTDGLLDPVRLSHDALARAKRELGAEGYGGEFEQNPQLAAGLLLPLPEMLTYDPGAIEFTPEDYCMMAIDPADKGDDFAAPAAYIRDGYIYIDEWICNADGLDMNIPAAVDMAKRHNPATLHIEGNGGWVQTAKDIREGVYAKSPETYVLIYNSHENKEARIEAQAFYIRNRVLFRANWRDNANYAAAVKCITSYIRGQKNKNDDAIDILSKVIADARKNNLI